MELVNKIKNYFSNQDTLPEMTAFTANNYLDEEYSSKTSNEIKNNYSQLRRNVNDNYKISEEYLNSFFRYSGQIIGGIAITLGTYNLFGGHNQHLLGMQENGLMNLKLGLEIPIMYTHIKKTKDIEGLFQWSFIKIFAYKIPIFGPLLDFNNPKRIIQQKIMKNSAKDFLEEKMLE